MRSQAICRLEAAHGWVRWLMIVVCPLLGRGACRGKPARVQLVPLRSMLLNHSINYCVIEGSSGVVVLPYRSNRLVSNDSASEACD